MNAPTTPCPPTPELTAFESRIRTAGETTARLENLAALAGVARPCTDSDEQWNCWTFPGADEARLSP